MPLIYPKPVPVGRQDIAPKLFQYTVDELPDIVLDFTTATGKPEQVWENGVFSPKWAHCRVFTTEGKYVFELSSELEAWSWKGEGIGMLSLNSGPAPEPSETNLGWVIATDHGAVADNATNNAEAIRSMVSSAAGGGVLEFPDASGEYGIDGSLSIPSDVSDKIHFHGPATFRHLNPGPTGPGSFGHPDYLLHLLRVNESVDDVTFRDMTFKGTDKNDNVVLLAIDGRRLRFVDNNIGPGGREGIAQHNTEASSEVFVIGNHSDGVGSEYGVAPYTHNANQVVMLGNIGMRSGACVEQTGVDCVAVGNIFNTSDYSGMGMHSSTFNSSRMVCSSNVLAHTNHGILITELTQSVGRSIISSNVVYNSKAPFTVGAAADQVVYLHGNYTQSGSIEDAAIVVGQGKSVIANNIVDRYVGKCAVTTTQGSSAISVAAGSAVDEGTILTIPGVTGQKRVVHQRGFSIPAIGLDIDSAADATVIEAIATYETPQWPLAVRAVAECDWILKDNYFLGVSWSSIAIQMTGITGRIVDNVFDPRDQSYGEAPILQVFDSLRQFLHGELFAYDFDVTKPWAYGGASLQSKQYLHVSRAQGAPDNLTWRTGDEMVYTDPVAGGHRGLVCVKSGTAGFCGGYSSTGGTQGIAPTGSIENGSTTLEISSARGFVKGCYITIVGVSGTKKVTAVSANTLTLDEPSDSTVSNAVVGYSAPIWKGYGAVTD